MFLVLPGPVNVLVVNASLQNGMRGAFWSLVGANAASLVLIGVAGALVYGAYRVNTIWFDSLSVFGGGYLLFYAFGQSRDLLKKSVSAEPTNQININDIKRKHSNLWLFSKGFGIGISNPKDVIFFMSFFPPFVNQLMLKAEIGFISSLMLLTLIWMVLDYSILLSYAKVFQKLVNEKVAKYIAWFGVFLFVCLGAWAVVGGIHAVVMSK
jgi:threonine/homoserine/homoserine lactone efflux protein